MHDPRGKKIYFAPCIVCIISEKWGDLTLFIPCHLCGQVTKRKPVGSPKFRSHFYHSWFCSLSIDLSSFCVSILNPSHHSLETRSLQGNLRAQFLPFPHLLRDSCLRHFFQWCLSSHLLNNITALIGGSTLASALPSPPTSIGWVFIMEAFSFEDHNSQLFHPLSRVKHTQPW